jgi:hypothetical protein
MDETAEKLKKFASEILAKSKEEMGLVRIGGNAFLDQDTNETIWTFEFDEVGTLYSGAMFMTRDVVEATAAGDFEPIRGWLLTQVGYIAAGFIVQGLELPDKIEMVIGDWFTSSQVKGNASATATLNKLADTLREEYKLWMAMNGGMTSHLPVGEA